MLHALQRSLAAQRQLVSDASHELRTPLTSLRINVELLAGEAGLSESERQEVLDRVVAQVAELGQLVANVTELARGEPVTSVLSDVRLDEVVAAGLEGARRDWPQTPFTADLEPCVVAGSAERLQMAVRNLLDNAAKFGPPGAPVKVRLLAGELTVRDRGPGIAPADLPHVFDRFYRAPSARGVPGSGLGLSIVRQVAESHGGTVQAESAPGRGTLIRLRLPCRTAPLPRHCPRVADKCARRATRCGGAGSTPCSRRIPATVRAIHALPCAVGCSPSCERGNVHPAASGSMMITLGSAARPAVTIAWSVR